MDDSPTELTTRDDIDKSFEILINSEVKPKDCMRCSKEFFPKYDFEMCDQCFFDLFRFPKNLEWFY